MTALRALARVVVAGVDLALFRIRRALGGLARGGAPLWTYDEAEAKARAVGYRGPLDPAGRWLEDLAAGRIDHDGRVREGKGR